MELVGILLFIGGIAMFSEERRDKIVELLDKDGRVFAKDLAELFEMSIDSIRRDLSIMEDKGLLKRTHGGAIPMPLSKGPRPPELRFGVGNEFENAVAKLAASYIPVHDCHKFFAGRRLFT
jgi:DeoR family fructose operon transcriptional repressor